MKREAQERKTLSLVGRARYEIRDAKYELIMIYLQAILVLSVLGGVLAAFLLIAHKYLANYGPCEISINDEEPFTIEGGRKILDELYDKKIFIPSACGGQGTCGFCKINVLEGGGPVLPTELPFLSECEVENKTRLACQVKVRENLKIHIKEEFLHVKEFYSKVSSVQMITHDTREIRLKLIEPDKIEFRSGQYVQIFVPGTDEITFRAYSVSSAPSNMNEIELLVRLIPDGLGSTYLHEVEVGDEVKFTGPYGEFVLTDDKEAEIICVGGGCGMAPMRSILRYLSEVSPAQSCSLYFGARTTDDSMYMDDFKKMAETMPNLKIHYALSEPEKSPDWSGETGFIHESVDKHLKDEGKRQAFLCGPPLMIEATMKVLKDKGVKRDMVFYDEF
ncbi:NADH:ubiquinone reductase (Na(+)-transporting) subunit F [Verrucomicrobiota bacterium]